MKRLFIIALFCGAFLAARFSGESPVAESAGGQGGVTVSGNGDVNGDNGLDLSDAIYLLTHLFQGGPAPLDCPGGAGAGLGQGGVTVSGNGDVNGDNGLDLSDAIYLLTHLFQGGPAPLDCPGTPTTETNCTNGADDDEDGATDCDDADCTGVGTCPDGEICDNGVDDDEDGATDCSDCDCATDPTCELSSCPAITPDCPQLSNLGFTLIGTNPQGFPYWQHDQTGILFVELPGGTVNMGAQSAQAGDPNFDPDAEPGEDPVHMVTLGPFLIAETEVTQAQYEAVVTGHASFDPTPSFFTGDPRRPVDSVEWNKLRGLGGNPTDGFLERTCLSLPTEAQWEYACRGGQAGPISGTGNIDDMAWYGGNSDTGNGLETHPVGTKTANQFGLFDMHGNVLEMCEDDPDPDFYSSAAAAGPDPLRQFGNNKRVTRGGEYRSAANACRSAGRGGFFGPGDTFRYVGFRTVFTVPRCSETNCGDGVDNDLDHATDCDDSDCASDPACDAGCGPQPAPIDGFTLLGCNAQGLYEFEHDQTGIVCVQLPGGTFDMGAQSAEPLDPHYDPDAQDNEGPVHTVPLSSFLIGKYEVTQCQWEAVMTGHPTIPSIPSGFSGNPPEDGDRPVESVQWNWIRGTFGNPDGFLDRTCPPLSLPTEAQWEYACRAGQEGSVSGNGRLNDMGWHNEHVAGWYQDDSGTCQGRGTHPVGQKLPNHFGLFDMHGNVTEVCEDVFNPTFYSDPEATDPDPIQACLGMSCGTERPARRGGGWKSSADDSRSFSRQDVKRNDTFDDTGFRVVFCPQGCPTSIPPPP